MIQSTLPDKSCQLCCLEQPRQVDQSHLPMGVSIPAQVPLHHCSCLFYCASEILQMEMIRQNCSLPFNLNRKHECAQDILSQYQVIQTLKVMVTYLFSFIWSLLHAKCCNWCLVLCNMRMFILETSMNRKWGNITVIKINNTNKDENTTKTTMQEKYNLGNPNLMSRIQRAIDLSECQVWSIPWSWGLNQDQSTERGERPLKAAASAVCVILF